MGHDTIYKYKLKYKFLWAVINLQTARERNKDFFWKMVEPRCRRCGYTEFIPSLQLHHIDEGVKEHKLDSLGYWVSLSRYKLVKKLSETKFTILCSNCHIKLHSVLRERHVHINPIDVTIFKEMLKCMHRTPRFTKRDLDRLESCGNKQDIEDFDSMDNIIDVDECRELRRKELGIICYEEDCGFCGIEEILTKGQKC